METLTSPLASMVLGSFCFVVAALFCLTFLDWMAEHRNRKAAIGGRTSRETASQRSVSGRHATGVV